MIFSSIAIASDHRGYQMKSEFITYFDEQGYRYTDFGTGNETTSVDYPDFANMVVDYVKTHEHSLGVLICHSGVGMSIVANRCKGIRAVLCYSEEIAKLSREHNNANVLCFGAGFIDISLAKKCFATFIETPFDSRHSIRLEKIDR